MTYNQTSLLPGGESDEQEAKGADYYPTPRGAIVSLLDSVEIPPGDILEPCAGDGAIVRTLLDYGYEPVDAQEIRASQRINLEQSGARYVFTGDYLRDAWKRRHPNLITNPPFKWSVEIVSAALGSKATWLAFLLPAAVIARNTKGQPWAKVWECKRLTAIYGLAGRPSFTGTGTAFSEYAWFVFDSRHEPIDLKIV